ncbi:MAG: putative bifunctional diguanylate cyclase/phosphodiesterase [Acidimicrobiales bacterium]
MATEDRVAQRARSGGGAGAVIRVFVFSGFLFATTAALLLWGPAANLAAIRPLVPEPVAVALLVVLFAAVNLAPVSVRVRGQVSLVALSEIPLLLGLVIVAPWLLAASRLIAEGIVFGVVRRQPLHKLSYNLSAGVVTAAIAACLYRQLLGSHSAVGPISWAAGVVALAAAAIAAHLSISVVRLLYGQARQQQYASATMVSALVLIASIGLAFVVLDAAWWDMWAIIPLALVGALIVFAYRGYLRLTDRFGALQQLYGFSKSVAVTSLETSGIAWVILEQVQTVMRTRRAELVLLDETRMVRRLGLNGAERSSSAATALDDRSLAAEVIAHNKARMFVGRGRARGQEVVLDSLLGEVRDAIFVPLTSGDRVLGVLAGLDRDEGFEPFDEDDLRLFEALAAHASATMERERLVEELRLEAESKTYQATHDALTGLPNRRLFLERAAVSLAETGRAAVALFDLDRFKEVNDTLGHGTGDRLLCKVAECLVRAANGKATVARLGGDEFALVIAGIIGPEEAIGIVRDLAAAISGPMEVDGIALAVTASAGISLAPDHGDNVATLLQRADIAMYRAKDRRSGIELYSASHDQSMQRRLLLGGQLAEAASVGKQLSLMYQPIADLSTGEIVRVEALARWFHPDHGQVPADEFIAIAEQMGFITKITDFVLREGCRQISELRRAGAEIDLSVNLSGRDLSDRSLVAKVAARLLENELPPHALSLEITETAVMADIGEASRVLAEIGELGVRVAVDDYGTGHSSLAYLHHLPINELKLDRSFVGNIATDKSNAIIVRSSIAMAHSLGLTVVAEGAEDEMTCAILSVAECDAMQGYYLSAPLYADDLGRWLATDPRLKFTKLPAVHPLRLIAGRMEELA